MSEACSLRPVTEFDLGMVLAWRNDPGVRRAMGSQHEIGLDEHQSWFVRVASDAERRIFIVDDSSGPIGFAQLRGVCHGGIAQWGFYRRPDSPVGSGRRLGRAVLAHAFGQLGLHKVWGQVLMGNHVSIALHRKLGFKEEGVMRDHWRINGEYCTVLQFGLLSAEWANEQ